MMKFSKFFEVAYLGVAVFFLYEAVRLWDTESSQSFLFIFLSIVAVGMFFFRRHFRKKYENRKK